jgi:hypothetical protein
MSLSNPTRQRSNWLRRSPIYLRLLWPWSVRSILTRQVLLRRWRQSFVIIAVWLRFHFPNSLTSVITASATFGWTIPLALSAPLAAFSHLLSKQPQ